MTTASESAPVELPPARTRACPFCGSEMERGFGPECPSCGWEMGLIPIGETKDSHGSVVVQFAAEPPVRYGRIALLIVTFGGFIALLSGLGSSLLVALVGFLVLVAGVVVWRETRFARVMYGLTPGMKIFARLVLVIGTFVAFCTIVGFLVSMVADRSARSSSLFG